MLDTYRGGYTKALLDVKEILEKRSNILSHRKLISKKDIRFVSSVINAMISQKDLLMTYGSAGVDMIQQTDGSIRFREI